MHFGLAAYPQKFGSNGRFTFLVIEDNVVWKKDTGGKLPEAFPEDPAKEGWERAE